MDNHKRSWWKESVVYQIYPRSFQDTNDDGIGDLRGIINRLPYLQELGIDAIWLCPVYDSPNNDNGYDIRDYFSIMKEFGTMEDMLELISQAKKCGIRILMDLVANHTSDEHAWFMESRKKDSSKRDWYIWRPGKDGNEPTNWESIFGGSAWEYDEASGEYYLHAFSKKQPDLNWENADVRDAVYSLMDWWLDKGIAGFRLDAITFLKKDQRYPQLKLIDNRPYVGASDAWLNQPGLLDFLQEMKQKVLMPREAVTVAEAPGVDITQVQDFLDEEKGVFNMLFQFDHIDLDIKGVPKGELRKWKLSEFKGAMAKWQKATQDYGWMALYMENHDQVRSVSKFGNDDIYRVESSKMLAAYYMLMRGTPFIYQGQEIGMTNCSFDSIDEYRDVDAINFYKIETERGRSKDYIMDYLAKRSRDNGRTPMQWSEEPMGGFTRGVPWIKVNPNYKLINVEQSLKDDNSVLNFYKRIIRLRKENKALIYGSFKEVFEDSDIIGGYIRTFENEIWTVICNFTGNLVHIPKIADKYIVLTNISEHQQGVLKPFQALVCKSTKDDPLVLE
ncbi:alpha-glucosidase [Clostridium thermarum]|uniref:alpha-glucosidase n=1 Tax=Clostridium thermarum TaxID=1716543 RepID=UPI0011211FE7|nr:alpha-glucosidase [Clostridium thermarum]